MSAVPTAEQVTCPVCGVTPGNGCVNRNDDSPTVQHSTRDQWAEYVTRCKPFIVELTAPVGDLPAGQQLIVRKVHGEDTLLAQSLLPDRADIDQEIPTGSAVYRRALTDAP